MTSRLEKLAYDLFIKLGDSINQAITQVATKLGWRDARGRRLRLVRLYTDEHSLESEPWKDIFYVNLFFYGEEIPTLIGVGSLTRNQIVLSMDLVPKEFWAIFHDKFFFSVIPVHESFAKIKEDCLKAWRAA